MTKHVPWNRRSPEERAKIEEARSAASYNNPFSGKNQAQRQRLHYAFMAMHSGLNR